MFKKSLGLPGVEQIEEKQRENPRIWGGGRCGGPSRVRGSTDGNGAGRWEAAVEVALRGCRWVNAGRELSQSLAGEVQEASAALTHRHLTIHRALC